MTQNKKLDKAGKIIESIIENGGKRTVIQGIIAPKAGAPPHYHNKCSETFEVVEGELSVWIGKKKSILTTGQTLTVEKTLVHAFKNESKSDIVINVTIEPGDIGWENTVHVAQGLSRDGEFDKFSKFTYGNVPYFNFMMKTTNTIPVGFAKIMFSFLTFLHGKKKLEKYEQGILEKYCK